MKASGPVLIGLVLGVVAFAAANNPGDDASLADAMIPEVPADDEEPDEEPDDDGDSPADAPGAPPDTGGATLPELPAGTDGAHVVTLTFDDGPHPVHTPQVLDLLAIYDAPAVFCVLGEQAEKHPELVRRIADEGHTLCNHTFSHDQELAGRPAGEIEAEITRTARAIEAAAPGAAVPFFRQPGGYVPPEVAAVAADQGLASLDWTVDPRDWSRPGTRTILETVLEEIGPHSVVLLHDGGGDRSQTVAALAMLLPRLADAGYEAVAPAHDS